VLKEASLREQFVEKMDRMFNSTDEDIDTRALWLSIKSDIEDTANNKLAKEQWMSTEILEKMEKIQMSIKCANIDH